MRVLILIFILSFPLAVSAQSASASETVTFAIGDQPYSFEKTALEQGISFNVSMFLVSQEVVVLITEMHNKILRIEMRLPGERIFPAVAYRCGTNSPHWYVQWGREGADTETSLRDGNKIVRKEACRKQ